MELGLLFYVSNGCLEKMGVKPLLEEEARKYIDAKLFTSNREEGQDDSAAPPAYFVPFSAFVPMEATLAESLKAEDLKPPPNNIVDQVASDPCDDPDCPFHGDSEEAKEKRREIQDHPVVRAILVKLGLID